MTVILECLGQSIAVSVQRHVLIFRRITIFIVCIYMYLGLQLVIMESSWFAKLATVTHTKHNTWDEYKMIKWTWTQTHGHKCNNSKL